MLGTIRVKWVQQDEKPELPVYSSNTTEFIKTIGTKEKERGMSSNPSDAKILAKDALNTSSHAGNARLNVPTKGLLTENGCLIHLSSNTTQ